MARVGSKKRPVYRVIVADSRMPRDGRHLEVVGRYNPRMEPSLIEFDREKATEWLNKGAQPSETVTKLLKIAGIEAEPASPTKK